MGIEPGDHAGILKKIRLGMLEPELQREITELAAEMGYEATITASSNLHFLHKIYQAEKVKGKRSARALQKAEDMILRLSSLHHAVTQREEQRRKEEKRKRIPLSVIEGGLSAGKRTRSLLASIGVEDESVASRAEELLGEKGVAGRVELVQSTTLGEGLTRKFFSTHPEIIMIPGDGQFSSELEAMEGKKEMIDAWSRTTGRRPPLWADYGMTPGILLDSYEDIRRSSRL